jgi:hypothetical protein
VGAPPRDVRAHHRGPNVPLRRYERHEGIAGRGRQRARLRRRVCAVSRTRTTSTEVLIPLPTRIPRTISRALRNRVIDIEASLSVIQGCHSLRLAHRRLRLASEWPSPRAHRPSDGPERDRGYFTRLLRMRQARGRDQPNLNTVRGMPRLREIVPVATACTMSVCEITPTRTPLSSTRSRRTSP